MKWNKYWLLPEQHTPSPHYVSQKQVFGSPPSGPWAQHCQQPSNQSPRGKETLREVADKGVFPLYPFLVETLLQGCCLMQPSPIKSPCGVTAHSPLMLRKHTRTHTRWATPGTMRGVRPVRGQGRSASCRSLCGRHRHDSAESVTHCTVEWQSAQGTGQAHHGQPGQAFTWKRHKRRPSL